MQTEENLLPVFVSNPSTGAIAGAILVTESIFGSIFGLLPASPATPAAPAAPAPAPLPAAGSAA
jgi:hypothetical protein